MKNRLFVLLLFFFNLLPAFSQDEASWINDILTKAKLFIDSTDVKGCETNYVQPQEKPWTLQLSLLPSAAEVHPTIKDGPSAQFYSRIKINVEIRLSYRGYGISYSHALSNTAEQEFSFTNYSNRYGFELRSHQSNSFRGTLEADSSLNVKEPYKLKTKKGMLHETNFLMNAYYVFNYKKFSHPAALTGSVRQIKSCGSPLISLSYYQSTILSENDSLSYYWNDIKKVRIKQLSIGGGYAYNWVFGQESRCLIHASLMPMIAILQRNKLYTKNSVENIKDNTWQSGMQGSDNSQTTGQQDWWQQNESQNQTLDPSNIRMTAIMRFSFQYLLSKGLFVGYHLVYNRHDIGSTDGFRIINNDWMGNFYVGFRF